MSTSTGAVSVDEVMSTPVMTTPDTSVREAARTLIEHGIGSLLVVEGTAPAGIVTETDLVEFLADGGAPADTEVGAVMSSPLVSIEPSARLETAATRMKDNGVKKLPVIEDGSFVGVVTTTDISEYFPEYHPRAPSWME